MTTNRSRAAGFRVALASLAALLLSALVPAMAAAITPTIVNGANGQWLESGALGDNGGTSSDVTVSLLVNHDPGKSVTGIKVDDDYDGTDNTSSKATKTTTLQQPSIVNGYDYSRITYTYNAPTSNSGLSCPFIGSGTPTANRPIRIRAVLNDGSQTATANSSVDFIRYDCLARDDFPVITARSQNATSINPGDQVTFTYTGDDSDSFPTGNQTFGGLRYRLRRLSDNTTTTPVVYCQGGDNTPQNLSVTFPNRGRWVVEAELLNENSSCGTNPNAGSWWRIGSVDVNSPAASSPNVSLNVPRPNLNGNAVVTATVNDSADSGQGGVAQDLEFDLDENTANGVGGFEDSSLGNVSTGLTPAQRTRTINTTGKSPGLHTVRVRVGDNGALGGADNIRRTKIATATYLVDSPPVINDQSITAEAGDGTAVTLGATDADGDTLTYTVTTPPANGALTGIGDNRTYTPDADYAGPDSFTVSVDDGFGGTDTATISIQVSPQTAITTGPSGPINTQNVTYTFTSPTTTATFECSLDGATFTACTSPQQYTNLAEGQHTFEVRAVAAGNTDPTPATRTFTVDVTDPETTIDSGPGTLTNTDTPTFTFSSDQPASAFECQLDGGGYTNCATPFTTPSLSEGQHTFDVRAIDPAGNVDPSPATSTFTVDTVAPDTTIDSGPSGPTNTSAPTFTFSSDDNAATFECKIDSGTFNPCSSPYTTPTLPDGPHTLTVRAIDPAGNVDQTPDSRSFTIDTIAPETTIDVSPGPFTNDATPTFEFSSDDSTATFQCRVDSGVFAACSSPFQTAPLSEGHHTFQVRAVDPGGNADATPASRTFVVDTIAPETTITSGPTGATNDDSPAFEFSSDEADSTFECRIDSDPYAPCTSPFAAAGLSDGPHTFDVRATDTAANTDPTPASRSFTVDTAAPDTTIDSGPSGTIATDQATFQFSSTESGAAFECKLDSGEFEECVSPHTYTDLTEGAHTFEVRAVDAAGNADPSPPSSAFNVSVDPPSTTIDLGPAGTTNQTGATLTFSSDDPTATFECRLDGASFTACSSPQVYTGLADGAHTFRVRAIDTDGNTDPTPATRSWTVDTTAPNTTIDAGPSGTTKNNGPSFEFSANEPGSTFECRIDSANLADYSPCTSPRALGGLSDGAHTFDVRATDPAGNTGGAASRTFTVDATAPDTTISSGPSGTTAATTATFNFSSSEPGSSFTCTLDGSTSSCSPPKSYTGLDNGSHTFSVIATDGAGNADPTPATRTWTIAGSDAPQTQITGGPSGTITSRDVTFEFSSSASGATFECALDGAGFSACTSTQSYGGLGLGEHTFRVRSINGAGAVDATPATRNFTIAETSQPPVAGSKQPPKIDVAGGKTKLARSIQVATITCGDGPCSLSSASAKIKVKGGKKKGKKKRKKLTLTPTAPGQIAGGATAPVTLTLNAKAFRAITKRGKGKVKISLEASSPAGSTKAKTKLKLKAKKKKRKTG